MTDHEAQNRQVNVLLLYQGACANKPRDKIDEHFRRNSNFVKVKTVAQGDLTSDRTAFQEFRRLLETCDVAIALLTPDSRNASEAGNLWFEIGYWLAAKSAHTLLMLKFSGLDCTGDVKIISDLHGRNYKETTLSDWCQGAYKFIEPLLVSLGGKSAVSPDEQVLKSAIGKFTKSSFIEKSSLDELSRCDPFDTTCSYRRDAIVLSAELFAIFKVMEKQFLVQDAFRRISFHCRVLFLLGKRGDPNLETVIKEYASYLHKDFSDLNQLLVIAKESPDEKESPNTWRSFLENRIEHHKQNRRNDGLIATLLLPDSILQGMLGQEAPDRLNHFLAWGNDFDDRCEKKSNDYKSFYRSGFKKLNREEEDWWEKLEDQSIFSEEISRMLSGWSLEFYRRWYDKLVQAMQHHQSYDKLMDRFLKAVPYRCENNLPLFRRTWVDEGY